MNNRRWRVFAIIAVFVLFAGACGKKTPSNNGTNAAKIAVTIYGQGAWTGPYNYLVLPSFQGAQLRFDELNAEADYPATITFKQADTQGSGDKAPTAVNEVVNDANTVGVVGPAFSGESEASGDTYEQKGIPFVTQSATNPGLADHGWTFWYRCVGNDTSQGGLAAQFVVQKLSPTKLFVIHDKEAYGQGLAEVVRDKAKEAGVDVVLPISGIEPTDNYNSVISDVRASGADVLFYGGYDADFGKLVKQARDAGLTDLKMMSGDGSVSSTFLSVAGAAAEGVNLIIPSNLGGDFIAKYNEKVGSGASTVPVYAGEGYDVASLLGEGIKQAIAGGAKTPETIRAGIQTFLNGLTTASPYHGVTKDYAFTETHELDAAKPSDLFYIYEVKGGALNQLGSATDVLGL